MTFLSLSMSQGKLAISKHCKDGLMDGRVDGWMTCDLTSFFNSIAVISGRWKVDNESGMMNVCSGTLFTVEKISP